MKSLRNYWQRWGFGQTNSDPTDSGEDEEARSFAKLREFVYIDQRSVQSLLASTGSGRVAAEQTARDIGMNTSERNANIGVGAGPANVGVGGRRASQEGTETERVFSFDLIQSKFTQLYEDDDITPRILVDSDDSYDLRDDPLFLDLDRGTLLEVRGNIQLHPLYRIYRAMKYINDASPEESIADEEVLRLIEESLGEKIPIEIELDGISITEDTNKIRADSSGEDVNIVALLNENDLWTEPIQTLASNKQFTIFCRVEQTQPNWYPMKLIRVLESISPGLADEYNTLFERELVTALDAFEAGVDASGKSTIDEQAVREIVEFLAEEASTSVDDEQIETIVENTLRSYSPEEVDVPIAQKIELLKTAYAEFTDVISKEVFSKTSPEIRSEYFRRRADQSDQTTEREFTPHLEVNVIAIYW